MKRLSPPPPSPSYLIKLHRDARPEAGLLRGRLENLASGSMQDFASAEDLLRCLAGDALAAAEDAEAEAGAELPR